MGFFIFSKVFVFCIIVSFQVVANDLIVMKHEYGKRGWDGVKYEKVSVYPLPVHYPRYSSSESENILRKKGLKIDLDLHTEIKNNTILAIVNLKNYGARPVYIPELSFSKFSMSFLISTDNIMLAYLGGQFDYGGDFERDDWIEIHPGETISFTQVLNDNYEFLPGKRLYNLSSLEYYVVNDAWFVDKSINDSFISITTPETNSCYIKKNTPYILRERWLCIFDAKEKGTSLEDLLERFGFKSIYHDSSFKIRTNQVVVEIDGDNMESFYERN